MTRRLSLRHERLAELSPADLSAVAGGAPRTLDGCFAVTTGTCAALSLDCLTGYYPSINAPCTTA